MALTQTNSGLDLHLDLPAGSRGVREALERALRDAITSGRLAPDVAVPPSRALAGDLGVGRSTVTEAYAQLVAEGWLVARQGSATRVAARPTESGRTPADPVRSGRSPRYDLRPGFPDVTSFPRDEWLSAARVAAASAASSAFGYGPVDGQPALVTALTGYLGRARGVDVTSGRLVVCAGFTAGLRTLAAVLRGQGVRRIGVEAYGHDRHRAVLEAAGLEPVVLPVDDDGAVPDGLDRLGAVLLTPAHQFPLGVALTARRRAAFTAWAARTGGLVIEDDYDGEFRYDRRALGAVQALAPDHVVYAGTASKTLAPGLRLGWLVVPDRIADTLLREHANGHAQPAALEQLTLAQFLDAGRYDRHVRRQRLAYRRRRERLGAGLARRAPHVRLHGAVAGLHAFARLPDDADEARVVAAAAGRGLAVAGLGDFRARGAPEDGRCGLALGFATPPPNAFTSAVSRLCAALADATGEPAVPRPRSTD